MIFLLVVVFGIIPIAIVAVYLKRRADQGSQGSQGAPKGAKRPRGPDRSRSQAPEFAAFGHPEHTRLQAASLFSEDGATRPVDGLANPQYVVTSSSSGVSTLQHLYAASDGGIVLNEAGVEPGKPVPAYACSQPMQLIQSVERVDLLNFGKPAANEHAS